jgi:hypothetical protein
MRAVLLSLAFLAISATTNAQSQRATSMAGIRPPDLGSLILILPATYEVQDFESGVDVVLQEIHKLLYTAGYKTALLNKQNYEVVWRQELEAAESFYGTATSHTSAEVAALALTTLASRLTGETSAKLILLPRLVLRTALLSGTKAEWDGRQELIPTRGLFGGTSTGRGTTMAVSLQLLALTGTGEVAFKSYGGITLPYKVNFLNEHAEMRSDLFKSDLDISEGTRIALDPLLAPVLTGTR